MVENMNSSFAKMARMLPAVNRWCVSGTPIPNSLQGRKKDLLTSKRSLYSPENFRFVWSGVLSWS